MRYIELPVQYSTSTCTRQHEYAATAVYILHVHRSREHSAYNTLASDETRGKVEIQYKAEWCNGTTSVKMKTKYSCSRAPTAANVIIRCKCDYQSTIKTYIPCMCAGKTYVRPLGPKVVT